MRERIKRMEEQLGQGRRELALPIGIKDGDTQFTVRWGYWGGKRPRQTREETYPIERLDEIAAWLEQEDLCALPKVIVSRLHCVGDDVEELYDIWRGMGIEEGTDAWEWRVQTYIRDKGHST